MRIVADDKIPFLRGVLEPFADVVYVPGKSIGREHLEKADALLTRTRTRCNEDLLKGTSVKFVGTATIGYDHIDTAWCEANGIVWKNAPGCNAQSVNQYIASTLVRLSDVYGFALKDKVLGVVGVGNVGSKVVHTAEMLGMQVYLCDPPRVRNEGVCGFIGLDGILRECDIITFHVPLNRAGEDKTLHMLNAGLLQKVNKGAIIINTSRGEVADGDALKKSLQNGRLSAVVLDVWENEPAIDTDLMNLCFQATPHIAGYAVDGKAKGTAMVVQELSRYFNLGMDEWETDDLPEPLQPVIEIDCKGVTSEQILKKAILATYDAGEDDRRLRNNPSEFEKQRGDYPSRREFKAFTLNLVNGDDRLKRTCRKLGFKVL
ncbi:MAG: 4-phosphoerythronate dehydrogenase PdxB [Bacteroidales bacterium]|nr:4-phosphoerythronate dehydrogenase PdxB [Bacteroidales bacterium]